MQNEKNRTRAVTDVIIILVLTILTGTILIIACGANPADAYALFFRGIFGTKAGFTEIFVKACPLILTGLGCAVAYRIGFFNIGAEVSTVLCNEAYNKLTVQASLILVRKDSFMWVP